MKTAWKEKAIRLMLFATASTSILIVIGIFVFVGKEAGHFAVKPGLKELIGSRWMPVSFQKESFGLLPLITGSLLVTALATILTIPFGIGAAVYISELARPTEREILKPFIEILAGIPSVVIGFFGLVVLVPLIKSSFGLSTGLTRSGWRGSLGFNGHTNSGINLRRCYTKCACILQGGVTGVRCKQNADDMESHSSSGTSRHRRRDHARYRQSHR